MGERKRILNGNPVSAGIALAEAYVYEPLVITVAEGYFEAGEEIEYMNAFRVALTKTKAELQQLFEMLSQEDEEKAKIFSIIDELSAEKA